MTDIKTEPADLYPVGRDGGDHFSVSPTDVARFIALEQCERYLRLRLHERSGGKSFLADYGVRAQTLPPLLTRSGTSFEEKVERSIAATLPTTNLAATATSPSRISDNDVVVEAVHCLAPGEATILFQPRIDAVVDGWRVRGDLDILRLERSADGALNALIADVKSSATVKVEHRLQVAFYQEMLTALLSAHAIPVAAIQLGVIYRGSINETGGTSPDDEHRREAERQAARDLLGIEEGMLQLVADPESYRDSVRDLVTGNRSTARRLIASRFDDVPYHLSPKCDSCLYNEFCMKWSAERDTLSMLPHLDEREKRSLQRSGVTTMRELAALKQPRPKDVRSSGTAGGDGVLEPGPGKEALVRQLGSTWPVGPQLDELVHRARRYRAFMGDDLRWVREIPSKGYGSLPYVDATNNPNLVRVFIDAQHDYLNDRIYLLGSLVVACEEGHETPLRRRSIVHLTTGPPSSDESERDVLLRWIDETIAAVAAVAAPAPDGANAAPIHLIFYDRFEQLLLLDALGRHSGTILSATPLFDFMTQIAAFDSPIATFLVDEIRELKNYPMICQSLQAVAAFLKFDWNAGTPYRRLFNRRLFDFWGRLDPPASGATDDSVWYTSRARFGSQIPLEYAYAAWNDLEPPAVPTSDPYAPYRDVTPELLQGFQQRRIEALEWIAREFRGNRQTEKRPYDLSMLATYEDRAHDLAQALKEFQTIERHVYLDGWKRSLLPPPERRVLTGRTLLARYHAVDQTAEVAAANVDNECRRLLEEGLKTAYLLSHPEASRAVLSKEEKAASKWTQEGLQVRLRIESAGIDADLEEIIALSGIRVGDVVVVSPRWMADERLPVDDRQLFTPTPKKMLYNPRAAVRGVPVDRDAAGRSIRGWVEIGLQDYRPGSGGGYAFGSYPRPLIDGALYSLDEDPNSWYGAWQAGVIDGICSGERNTLYDRLVDPRLANATWPAAATGGQARFLDGLDAFHQAGLLHDFEESKREFIGRHGATPTLLVQGPPGTGKSYTTAFAIFARLQGAMTADIDYRVILSCKTHAATDVLLENMIKVRARLEEIRSRDTTLFDRYIDPMLLRTPFYRYPADRSATDGVVALPPYETGGTKAADTVTGARWCVLGATPGGVRKLIKERWPKGMFAQRFCHCLVLDEASQMNLPEAMMAALPLTDQGRLIVVGDHRQMAPIVQHDWQTEPRRTFQEYTCYESLFSALLPMEPPMIKFERSFRLHADMAEFLRQEIYRHDGISYHSLKADVLSPVAGVDGMVRAMLTPDHPLIVVVHEETASQQRNPFEQRLIAPVLEALVRHGLDATTGLGVVVPHRAQRAALQAAIPGLVVRDPVSGATIRSAVDTVERFQGDERRVILISATESDRSYLLASAAFLLDPRRLTVALSRAKHKMILVASRSVFDLFSADEETFDHARLWKNLLRRTCTVALWHGDVAGVGVEVWGNDRGTARTAEAAPPAFAAAMRDDQTPGSHAVPTLESSGTIGPDRGGNDQSPRRSASRAIRT